MLYDKEIIYVLIEAGSEGLSAKKISRHVHNSRNTLFNPISFNDVYREVKSYLRTNSRTELSIIKKIGKGLYCINNNVNDSRQLLFEFKDAITSESKSNGDELLLKLF